MFRLTDSCSVDMGTLEEESQLMSKDSQIISENFYKQTNPLLINTVLRSLFQHVDYDTLKNCRIVNKKWKEFSDPIWIKKSAFDLRCSEDGIPRHLLEYPVPIHLLFRSMDQEDQDNRITAFKFKLPILTTPIREIYLEPNLSTMTQLEINIIQECDLDAYNVDYLIGPNLVKLKLEGWWYRWEVSLDKLSRLQVVDLTNCSIIVNSNVKIAPVELKLEMFYLFHHDLDLLIQISEIIDFSSLVKLHLYQCGFESVLNLRDCANVKILSVCGMTINLNGKISAEELTLEGNSYEKYGEEIKKSVLLNDYLDFSHNIKTIKLDEGLAVLLNLKSPIIAIDTLDIQDLSTIQKGEMQANVREIRLTCNESEIMDLSLLPETLETLDLIANGGNNEDIVHPEHLLDMKNLYLRGYLIYMPHFNKCPSLTFLGLVNCDQKEKVELDNLPPKLKTLWLSDFNSVPEIPENKILNLELLVLSYTFSHADKFILSFFEMRIRQIKAELVIFIGDKTPDTDELFSEQIIAKIMDLREQKVIGNVAFGPMCWESDETFRNSILFTIVNKKAEYYLFDDKKGEGMNSSEFSKLIPFKM